MEIAPDLSNEDVGAISAGWDSGEWYASGAPAYWRGSLNFEGWRRVSSHTNAAAQTVGWVIQGEGTDDADIPNSRYNRYWDDPRYRLGEHPLGQHDRWYDMRGWQPGYYGGNAQTRKRIQFLHLSDKNLK